MMLKVIDVKQEDLGTEKIKDMLSQLIDIFNTIDYEEKGTIMFTELIEFIMNNGLPSFPTILTSPRDLNEEREAKHNHLRALNN